MEFDAEIDKLYSCSKWCPNISPVEVLRHHVEFMTNQSADSRKQLKYEKHYYVPDDPTEENKYNYFHSVGNSDKLLVYIHGGFWMALNVDSSTFLADFFVKRNCNFASIGYDLCPVVTLDTIVMQIRQALKNILTTYPNIEHIYVCGHSAGAHLALMSMVFDGYEDGLEFTWKEKQRFSGLVLFSGLYDIRIVCKIKDNDKLQLTQESAWRLSPIRCWKNLQEINSSMKILIICGEYDSPAFKEQSENLYALLKNKVHVTYLMEKDRHHFNLIEDLGKEDYAVTQLILEFLTL